MQHELGIIGATMLKLALFVNCSGMLVAYLVVIRDVVHDAVHQQLHSLLPTTHFMSVENVALAVIVVGVLAPLVSFR